MFDRVINTSLEMVTAHDNIPTKIQSKISQSVFTCSKLTIETLEQGVKYVQS